MWGLLQTGPQQSRQLDRHQPLRLALLQGSSTNVNYLSWLFGRGESAPSWEHSGQLRSLQAPWFAHAALGRPKACKQAPARCVQRARRGFLARLRNYLL